MACVVSVNVGTPVAEEWAGRLGSTAIRKRAVDGPDHVGDGDRLGLAGEAPAAGLPALRHHDVGTPEVGENGLEEAVRDPLRLAELLGADSRAICAHRDLDQGPQGVVGFGGYAHECSLSDMSAESVLVVAESTRTAVRRLSRGGGSDGVRRGATASVARCERS